MKTRISLNACQHAIVITRRWGREGIPLELDGVEQRITDIEMRRGRWYSAGRRFTRQEQELLSQRARAIIEQDRGPRVPPAISIRECQQAIELAGGIRISLRGEERLITEVRTGGAGNSRWFGGGLRFTAKEQELLTSVARTILQHSRKAKGQLRLPYLE
ncbi:MAG: hypothetical protein OXG96_05355 [Acidobacteria bacterium]|nr:hypothetical protein [Acidobacteriota bacterium]